jgi:hypothetical protein
MGWADFAEGLRTGCSARERSILAMMEDVVFVSERSVGKRRRDDDDDDASRKRVQVKEEDSGNDKSSSESESDDDSDDEPNGMVENAMSTIRISTEPQATPSLDSLIARIKARDQPITKQDMQMIRSSPQQLMIERHVRDAYLKELELGLEGRKIGGTTRSEKKRLKGLAHESGMQTSLTRPQGDKPLRNHVLKLERMCRSHLKTRNPVRLALEQLSQLRGGWSNLRLVPRLNELRSINSPRPLSGVREEDTLYSLRSKRTSNDTSHSPGVQGESSRSGGVDQGVAANAHAMQQEIQALKSELEREKSAGHEAARDARIAETDKVASFSQRIKDKDMLLEVQRKTQQDLAYKLQRCKAELAEMKSSRTDKSRHRSERDKKAVMKAEEASKAAKAKTKAMFEQYDLVQNKNTVLIGKLRMMAEAGGFDGPNTSFRKELDALKAPELTELDEYEEQE